MSAPGGCDMFVATDIGMRPSVAGSHGAEPPAASRSAIADVRGGDLVAAAQCRLTAAESMAASARSGRC